MHKFILTTIIAFMATNLGLYAQEKDTAQEEPQVKLELVWKEEFASPILDFVLQERKKTSTLRLVITADAVRFLEKGKEILLKSVRVNENESLVYSALCSRNGKYIGIRKDHYGEYGRLLEGSEYLIYDDNGNLLTRRNINNNYIPGILLNNGAFLVSGVLEDGRIFLEQPNGKKKVIFDYPDMRPSSYLDIAKKGDFFVLNISGIGIILYRSNGEEVWRKKFNWGDAANVSISDNAKYITAAGILFGGGLYLLSSNGNLLWKYPQENYYNFYLNCIDFSPDEEYFAANINPNEIFLFESSTGKILWNYKMDKRNELRKFFSIAVSRNGEFVAAADGGGRRELPSGDTSTIFLFDKEGNVVWQQELEIQKERAPSVRFTDDGRHLLVCNSNILLCYKIRGGQ